MFNLDEMKARLAALDHERDKLIPLIRAAEEYQRASTAPAAVPSHKPIETAVMPPKRFRILVPGAMQRTVNLAAKLMEERGQPISTTDVINAMPSAGLDVPEKNPVNVVSARLSNSDRFEGRRGIGWWFKDRPWPGEDSLAPPEQAQRS